MLARSFLAVGMLASFVAPSHAQLCDLFPDGLHRSGPGGNLTAFAVFDDGTGPAVYAGGELLVSPPGVAASNSLLKWNGQQWVIAFAFPTPFARVNTLVVHDDGSGPALFIGGDSLVGSGSTTSGLARFDGTTLTSVGAGVQGAVRALAVYDAGGGPDLYVGGAFLAASGLWTPNVIRWDGASYASIGGVIGSGSTVGVEDLLVHDDGSRPRLVVAGKFDFAGGVPAANIAKFGPGGWSTLGSGISGGVRDLVEHDFGSGSVLVASGTFANAGGTPAANIATWDGSTWSAMGAGLPATTTDLIVHDDGGGARLFAALEYVPSVWSCSLDGTAWQVVSPSEPIGLVRTFLVHDFGSGTKLYAGGSFDVMGGVYSPHFAGWDGAQWFAPEPANGLGKSTPAGGVFAQRAYQGDLYVAGSFFGAGSKATGSIARYDGTQLHALPGIPTAASNSAFYALEVFDAGGGEQLYAAGNFTTIPGAGTVRGIARWNGTSWSSLPEQPGIGSATWQLYALKVFDDGSGPALYAAGRITSDVPGMRGIARWRAGTWSAVGGGFTWSIDPGARVLAVHDDGGGAALYVGGNRLVFGSFTDGLARWDGTSWSRLGATQAIGDVSYVYALTTFDDGDGQALYVGGNFSAVAGVPRSDLARWKGGAWSDVGGGLSDPSGAVRSLTAHDDGRGDGASLFVGGYFPTQDGVVANSLARWDGSAWSTLVEGVRRAGGTTAAATSVVSATIDGRRDLFVGGDFEFAGSDLATFFARWPGCGETGETLCFGDGGGAACPCGNSSAVGARAGCTNSLGLAGTLRGAGESSLASDTLRLDGAAMPDTSVLYFQATALVNGGAGVAFGDGLRCGGGATVRIGTKVNSAGVSSYPQAGDASISVRGAVVGPTTRFYQARYRNSASFCTSEVFNWTNALRVVWGA